MPDNPRLASSAEEGGGNGSGAMMLWSPQTYIKWDQICVSVIDSREYKAEKFLALKWILPWELYSFQDLDLALMRKNNIRGKYSYKFISFIESQIGMGWEGP